MKRILLLIITALSSTITFAQNDSTVIDTYTSFLGYQYVQNDSTILMPYEMLEIFQNHPSAFNTMKIARSKRRVAQVFISTGAVVAGFALVSSITGQNFEWEAASIGAGLIIIGIPFNRSFHKHTQTATAIFNTTISPQKSAHLQLGVNHNGLGLTLHF